MWKEVFQDDGGRANQQWAVLWKKSTVSIRIIWNIHFGGSDCADSPRNINFCRYIQ